MLDSTSTLTERLTARLSSRGQALPEFHYPVQRSWIADALSVMLDPFPGFYDDAEYARSVGHRDVFMNTMALLGLFDRHVTDWAGKHTFIFRHDRVIRQPVYAGTTAVVRGHVASVETVTGSTDERTGSHVTVAATIAADNGVCVTGSTIVVIPDEPIHDDLNRPTSTYLSSTVIGCRPQNLKGARQCSPDHVT